MLPGFRERLSGSSRWLRHVPPVPGRLPGLCLGLLAGALVLRASSDRSEPGYLSVLGPTPVRFCPAPIVTPAPLPPLVMEDPKEIEPSSSPVATESATPDWSMVAPPIYDPLKFSQAPTPPRRWEPHNFLYYTDPSTTAASQTNTAPLISPELLMQFFTDPAGTNRAVAVPVPMNFSPASPPVPSSSARYFSNPKQ